MKSEDGGNEARPEAASALQEFSLERYRYILQQLNSLNEGVHKFLGIYQALSTAIIGGALALFVGYRNWGIAADVARAGIVFLLSLETVVAAFTVLMVIMGILSWLDYRREEVRLTEAIVGADFRDPPNSRNFWRWHETYIIAFIFASTCLMWIGASVVVLSNVR